MGLRSWAKKQAKKAKRKAEEAKRKAERKAREAKEAAERKAREAARAAERKAEQARRAFDDALDRTTDPVERLALKAERAIKEGMSEVDVRRMIRDELGGLKDGIKREVIDQIRDEVVRPIPALVTDKLPQVVTETLPDIADDVVKTALSKAFRQSLAKAFDTALDVIEMMAPSSYTFIAGAEAALIVQAEFTVSVEIPNPVAKLTEIRRYAAKPPKGRAQIMECFRTFGPSSFTGEAKVSGNGGAATWDGDDKYERIDAFLAKHGVE